MYQRKCIGVFAIWSFDYIVTLYLLNLLQQHLVECKSRVLHVFVLEYRFWDMHFLLQCRLFVFTLFSRTRAKTYISVTFFIIFDFYPQNRSFVIVRYCKSPYVQYCIQACKLFIFIIRNDVHKKSSVTVKLKLISNK